MKKPIAVIAIVVLLGLGSIALIFGGTIAGSIARGAKTSSNESQSSSTTIQLGNGSNSFQLGMNVIPTARLIPLGGSANFTVALYSAADFTGNYSLSAAGPSGLSFEFGAIPVPMSGAVYLGGEMRVSSSSAMSPGVYNVTIEATGSKGVASQTFDFHVQRNLVLVQSADRPRFSNLTVKVGDSVTWFSLDAALTDAPNGWHQMIFDNMTLTSGAIRQYESWSYTFTQPGSYRYYDNADPTFSGEVIVSP